MNYLNKSLPIFAMTKAIAKKKIITKAGITFKIRFKVETQEKISKIGVEKELLLLKAPKKTPTSLLSN